MPPPEISPSQQLPLDPAFWTLAPLSTFQKPKEPLS